MKPAPQPDKRPFWFTLAAVAVLLATLAAIAGRQPAAAQQTGPEPTLEAPVVPAVELGAPVIVNGRELFRITRRLGPLTAPERAALVSSEVEKLANNPFLGDVAVTVVDLEGTTDILYGADVLHTVTDADAADAGMERPALAEERATAIQGAIDAGRSAAARNARLRGLLITLLATAALAALIWVIDRVLDAQAARLADRRAPTRLPDVITRTHFYKSGAFSRFARSLLRLLKLALYVALALIYIPLVLELFPETRGIARRLLELILTPLARLWQGFVDFLPELFFLITVAVVTWIALRLLRLLFNEVGRGTIRLPAFDREWARPTYYIVGFIVVALGVIIAVTSLPISESPLMRGVAAFFGLLVTLSATSALANIIAGTIMTYTNAYHIGDVIEVNGTLGQVTGKHLLTTRVRTFKNEIVSLPNSLVLSHPIVNYSEIAKKQGLVVHTTVTIGYNVPWQQVHELLIAAAGDTEHIRETPPPFVLQTSLNDYHISYELNAYTGAPQYLPAIYSALHQNIQSRFNAAGVEIMSPLYAALRDGNALTLPPGSTPAGYRPAGFRVERGEE